MISPPPAVWRIFFVDPTFEIKLLQSTFVFLCFDRSTIASSNNVLVYWNCSIFSYLFQYLVFRLRWRLHTLLSLTTSIFLLKIWKRCKSKSLAQMTSKKGTTIIEDLKRTKDIEEKPSLFVVIVITFIILTALMSSPHHHDHHKKSK